MKPLTTNLLRVRQRQEMEQAREGLKRALHNPDIEDKARVSQNLRQLDRQLVAQVPEPLTGAEKDQLSKVEKRLRAKWTEGMLTEEEMRKNPAGAVDNHRRWEREKKKYINAWKNVTIQLNPDNDDKDLCNIERFRPAGAVGRMRTDAQIKGHMAYGNVPPDAWESVFDEPQNTALKQAQKHERETLEDLGVADAFAVDQEAERLATEAEKADQGIPVLKPRRLLTPEQRKAIGERLAAGRAKRAQRLAGVPVDVPLGEQVSVDPITQPSEAPTAPVEEAGVALVGEGV